MAYKLLILDLDHTFLSEDKTISRRNKLMVKRCLAAGIQVTFATGRLFPAALPYAQETVLTLPLISCQGAVISTLEGEVLYQQTLANQVAKNLLRLLLPLDLDVICCHENTVYAAGARADYQNKTKLAPFNHHHLPLPDDIGAIEPLKVGASGSSSEISRALALIHDHYGSSLHAVQSSPNFLEITHPSATKSVAAALLAQRLQIDPSEIIAIGDSMNDLDLLQFAGCGVAMANAVAEVKAVADLITASNEEDGVAQAIAQLIFHERSVHDDV